MASYIPFVNSLVDVNVLKRFYKEATIVRTNLHRGNVIDRLGDDFELWIDTGIDAF